MDTARRASSWDGEAALASFASRASSSALLPSSFPVDEDEAQRARLRAKMFGGAGPAGPPAAPSEAGSAGDLARALLAASREESLDGELIGGRYQVRRPLGRGGMGQVYLAEDRDTGREVALKVLNRRHQTSREVEERFVREARAASRIRHRNVVELYDFGRVPDGRPYFTMEYLPGRDLRAVIDEEGPLEFDRARRLLLQICAALQAAHERGIIHRDVKPANCRVVVEPDGSERLEVLDFGIAKAPKQLADEHSLTRTGAIMGTVGYMAPEQAKGRVLDPRADLYSVGVIAFEMLTGRLPFRGESPMVLLSRQATQPPPRLEDVRPGLVVPEGFEDLLQRVLDRDRSGRPETAAHLAVSLRGLGPMTRSEVEAAATTGVASTEMAAAGRMDPDRRRILMVVVIFLVAVLIAALSLG